jgi:serine/threonine-protein kinase
MAGGAGHTCAIQGGKLFCWGLNDDGQLGTGAFASATGPANTGLTGVDRIAAGFNLTCALFQSGDLKCWGANDKGQLGNGSNLPAKSPSPLAVTGR